jgi:hypothetical protein
MAGGRQLSQGQAELLGQRSRSVLLVSGFGGHGYVVDYRHDNV